MRSRLAFALIGLIALGAAGCSANGAVPPSQREPAPTPAAEVATVRPRPSTLPSMAAPAARPPDDADASAALAPASGFLGSWRHDEGDLPRWPFSGFLRAGEDRS